MPGGVGQAFLNDPIYGDVDLLAKPVQIPGHFQRYRYLRVLAPITLHEFADGLGEPEMIQSAGAELPDDGVHHIIDMGRDLDDGLCILPRLRQAVAGTVGDGRADGPDGRDTLPQFVVQFTGNGLALLLELHLDQLRELSALLELQLRRHSLPVLGHVADGVDLADHLVAAGVDQWCNGNRHLDRLPATGLQPRFQVLAALIADNPVLDVRQLWRTGLGNQTLCGGAQQFTGTET